MDAALTLASAGALLLLPGLLLWAVGGRGGALHWTAAPAVTVALVAPLALLFGAIGIPWRPATALPALLALALGGGLLARRLPLPRSLRAPRGGLGTRRRGDRRQHDPGRGPALAVTGWLVLVLVVHSMAVLTATRGLDRVNNSYDAFFHTSLIASIRADGDASMLSGTAPMYSGSARFYPTAFHALAALLPGGPVADASALSLMLVPALAMGAVGLAAVVLPGCRSAWVRALLTVAAAGTALIHRSPDAMGLVMGLWPNLLGAALLPAVLGTAVRAARCLPRPGHGPSRARGGVPRGAGVRIALQVLTVAAGAALAHPTTLFALGIVLAAALGAAVLLGWRQGAPARRWAPPLVLLVLGGGMFALLSATALRSMDLTGPPVGGTLGLLRDLVADRPRIAVLGRQTALMLPWIALAVWGAVTAWRRSSGVGITAVLSLLGCGMIVVAGTSHYPVLGDLSNAWYGARERLVPLQICALVVLVAIGLHAVARSIERALGRGTVRGARGRTAALAACALLALAPVGILALPSRVPLMAGLTTGEGGRGYVPYVSIQEQAFIARTAAQLPPGAVVLGDPLDGTAAYWSVGGVSVVYPSLADPGSLDTRRVARYGHQLGEDPNVCASMRRLHVAYLYRDVGPEGAERFATRGEDRWAGLRGIDGAYLEPVAAEGPYRLYRVTLPC